MTKIAFDIDGTLIRKDSEGRDIPRYEIINLLRSFYLDTSVVVLIWSGSGLDYARTWADKLGLQYIPVINKDNKQDIDVCFDDEEVELAKVNIKV